MLTAVTALAALPVAPYAVALGAAILGHDPADPIDLKLANVLRNQHRFHTCWLVDK